MEKKKIESFQYGHFIIPLYRHPMDSVASIFIPLWLLGIINLAIYYQEVKLADRVGSLATLIVAHVALIPIIRENVPPNSTIAFVEILIYLNSLSIISTLV